MGVAVKGLPEEPFNPPPGVIVMPVNPETGLRATDGIPEFFFQEFPAPDQTGEAAAGGGKLPEDARNQLF